MICMFKLIYYTNSVFGIKEEEKTPTLFHMNSDGDGNNSFNKNNTEKLEQIYKIKMHNGN